MEKNYKDAIRILLIENLVVDFFLFTFIHIKITAYLIICISPNPEHNLNAF
jgi:hypothetical protein